MLPDLEPVELALGQILSEPYVESAWVYFPGNSLVSLIAVAAGGKGLEVGMVGYEGMCGAQMVAGAAASPARALVQGAGSALRMGVRGFRAELKRNKVLHGRAMQTAFVTMATSMQVAACNNAHALEPRLARWLLTTSDCLAADSFYLTQKFLADMVGVRRTGVSPAAAGLQKRGLVQYSRGLLTIVDRQGLHAAACGCYDIIRKLTARPR